MRAEDRRQGWVSADSLGSGKQIDEQGRLTDKLAQPSGLFHNADGELDIDLKNHAVIKALLARIAALERGG